MYFDNFAYYYPYMSYIHHHTGSAMLVVQAVEQDPTESEQAQYAQICRKHNSVADEVL